MMFAAYIFLSVYITLHTYRMNDAKSWHFSVNGEQKSVNECDIYGYKLS